MFRELSMKKSSEPRAAATRYFSRDLLILSSVSLDSATLTTISSATRLDSSSDSMSTTSSVKSPSASASFAKSVSSSSLSLMVNSLFCTMSAVLVSSRSGRSLFTTSASSWSSRPSCVTVKLMSVVSAWISGG